MTTIARKSRATKPDAPPLVEKLYEAFVSFRELKRIESDAKQQHERMRDTVFMPALEKAGRPWGNQGQHLAIPLPDGVDGYKVLVRRANTTRLIDVDAAEELADEKGFLAEIQTTTVSFTFSGTAKEAADVAEKLRAAGLEFDQTVAFDQARLMSYHQQHRDVLTEKMLDGLFVDEVRYSFAPEKG